MDRSKARWDYLIPFAVGVGVFSWLTWKAPAMWSIWLIFSIAAAGGASLSMSSTEAEKNKEKQLTKKSL